MPLARIITNSADDSLELSMQLRSRGFRVETVAPDHIPETPADVEVRLEECTPEDVLTRAVVKESEDLRVFVAPGALNERARPMRMVPPIPRAWEVPATKVVAPPIDAKTNVVLPQAEANDDPVMAELAPDQAAIQAAGGNGSTARAASLTTPIQKSMTAPPPAWKPAVAVKSGLGPKAATKLPAVHALERAKVVTLAKPAEIPQIPKVPERVEPILATVTPAQNFTPSRRRPYKITFETGPKFWRTASTTVALVFLAGFVAMVMAVRPPLPLNGKTAAVTSRPGFFSPAPQFGSVTRMPEPDLSSASPKQTTARARSSHGRAAQAAAMEHPSRLRSSSDDGLIADDTVVFYDRPRIGHPAKEPSHPVSKRYSNTN